MKVLLIIIILTLFLLSFQTAKVIEPLKCTNLNVCYSIPKSMNGFFFIKHPKKEWYWTFENLRNTAVFWATCIPTKEPIQFKYIYSTLTGFDKFGNAFKIGVFRDKTVFFVPLFDEKNKALNVDFQPSENGSFEMQFVPPKCRNFWGDWCHYNIYMDESNILKADPKKSTKWLFVNSD